MSLELRLIQRLEQRERSVLFPTVHVEFDENGNILPEQRKALPGVEEAPGAIRTAPAVLSIDYTLCPQSHIESEGDGSHIGFSNSEGIFLRKDLHVAVQPFVAWKLHHERLSRPELGTLFGVEQIQAMPQAAISDSLLRAALLAASEVLREEDLAGLAKLLLQEPEYVRDPARIAAILTDIVHLIEEASSDLVLVTRKHDRSRAYYLDRTLAYHRRYDANRFVRMDEAIADLHGNAPELAHRLVLGDGHVARATSSILAEPSLNGSLELLLESLDDMSKYEKGHEESITNPLLARLLYCCELATSDRTRPAVEFLPTADPSLPNRVRFHRPQFFGAVRRRLTSVVIRRHDELTRTLSGTTHQQVEALFSHAVEPQPPAQLQSIASQSASQALALQLRREDALEHLTELQTDVSEAITLAPKRLTDCRRALHAQRLLESLDITVPQQLLDRIRDGVAAGLSEVRALIPPPQPLALP